MATPSTGRTSPSLLARLQRCPTDQVAWDEFVGRYARQIYSWCREWHLQDADAEDVTQQVLLILARKMGTFHYDPARRFRGWLRVVARHAWEDLRQGQQRPGAGTGDSRALAHLHSIEAGEDLARRLEGEFDQELLEEAAARVRQRVQASTWEAFRLLALEGLSGAEAAQQLGMKVATVFVARSKVQRMLREEVQALERACPGGEEQP